jgi:hypothetical protein
LYCQVSSGDLEAAPGADLLSGAEVRQAAGGLVPVTPPSKRPVDPIERDDEPGGAPGDGAACVLLGRPAASAPVSIAAFAWAAAPGDVIAALAPAGSRPVVVTPAGGLPVPPAAIGLGAVLGALDVLREGGSHEITRNALALTAATGRGAHGIRLERDSH